MNNNVCIMLLAILAAMSFSRGRTEAQEKTAGLLFAYNEISASFQKYTGDKSCYELDVNLDLTGVVAGTYRIPGVSAELCYSFIFASRQFRDSNTIRGFAGPGFTAGYLRSDNGEYGFMAGLCGMAGFEYIFDDVPVSLSLSLRPTVGVHINRSSSRDLNMELYRYGLIASVMPHLGIRYHF